MPNEYIIVCTKCGKNHGRVKEVNIRPNVFANQASAPIPRVCECRGTLRRDYER